MTIAIGHFENNWKTVQYYNDDNCNYDKIGNNESINFFLYDLLSVLWYLHKHGLSFCSIVLFLSSFVP